MTITIIQSITAISFISLLYARFGHPLPSISDSWYSLPSPLNHLFTAFCWTLGFAMPFQSDGSSGWFFLSGSALCFTGTSTMFRSAPTRTIHYISAVVAIISAFAGLFIERGQLCPFLLFSIVSLFLYRHKNHVWWIEISAIICILFGLFITNWKLFP